MYKKIAINLGTGYFFKVVQICCGLVTVPVLVSKNGLGLEGYGQLAVALSMSAMWSMAFDGFRLVVSKRIGASADHAYLETKKLLCFMSLLSLPFLLAVLIVPQQILVAAGLENFSPVLVHLLFASFVTEQLLYVTEQYFHSELKSKIVNLANSVEAVLRLAAILYVFGSGVGSIYSYIILFIITSALKIVLYWALIFKDIPSHSTKFTPIRSDILPFIKEAIPLSFRGAIMFYVFRLSVILANKYLSAADAAIFSIIFVTIRGYLSQIFVTVMRPMIIPLASKHNFKLLQPEKVDLVYVFEMVVFVSALFLAATSCLWVTPWLGHDFNAFHATVGFALAVLGIESALSLKSLILISQGYGSQLTAYSLFSFVIFLVLSYLQHGFSVYSLNGMVVVISIYVILYNGILVNLAYTRNLFRDKHSIISALVVTSAAPVLYVIQEHTTNIISSLILSVGLWCITFFCLVMLRLKTLTRYYTSVIAP